AERCLLRRLDGVPHGRRQEGSARLAGVSLRRCADLRDAEHQRSERPRQTRRLRGSPPRGYDTSLTTSRLRNVVGPSQSFCICSANCDVSGRSEFFIAASYESNSTMSRYVLGFSRSLVVIA